MFSVRVQESADAVVLRCFGRVVAGEETPILCAVAGRDGGDVILDLKEVDEIDVTGIRLLMSLQAAGFYLRLVNPTAKVRATLTATQLDSVVEVCDSELTDDRGGEETTDFRPEVTTPTPNWSVPRLVTC
jgi:anti-anti-sigma factor